MTADPRRLLLRHAAFHTLLWITLAALVLHLSSVVHTRLDVTRDGRYGLSPVAIDAVAFGEVALSGELRPVAHGALRLKEAAKLGFERALVPAAGEMSGSAMAISRYATLGRLVDDLLGK